MDEKVTFLCPNNIQAQAQNRQKMEVEHMITKELILGHEKYEKLENRNGIQVPEVKPFQ